MVYMARSSDKHYERSYHAMAGAALVFLGYLLLLILTGRSGLYVAVCIAVSGIFVINPVVNAWLTSNIAPSMKKSVATAMAVSANNSAGLLGSHIYQHDDAPRYSKILNIIHRTCRSVPLTLITFLKQCEATLSIWYLFPYSCC